MLHLRLHIARNFKKNAPTGSQKRAAATPFMTKNATAANSKTQLWGQAPRSNFSAGVRPRDKVSFRNLTSGPGPST